MNPSHFQPLRALIIAAALTLSVDVATAALPSAPSTPEAQAKAEEAKSKAAAAAKKAAEDLEAAQNKAVANFNSRSAK